jgi:Flp pilus assembly pilin Flp
MSLRTVLTSGPARVTRFLRDNSGVAAMEFALIAPMLIGMYIGLAELSTALNADRKMSHSASVAGDLATQLETLNAAQTEDLISAVLHVARLKNGDEYAVNIETFERETDGTVKSGGLIKYSAGGLDSFLYDPDDFDEDILPKGTGIVAATVRFRYRPFGFEGGTRRNPLLPAQMDMEETFLLKPRRSDVLQFGPDENYTTITCSGKVDSINCTEQTRNNGGSGDDDDNDD